MNGLLFIIKTQRSTPGSTLEKRQSEQNLSLEDMLEVR